MDESFNDEEFGVNVPLVMCFSGIWNFILIFFFLSHPMTCLFYTLEFLIVLILLIPGLLAALTEKCCYSSSIKINEFCDWFYQLTPIKSPGVLLTWLLQLSTLIAYLVYNKNFFWDD